jgi:hypothetical protein
MSDFSDNRPFHTFPLSEEQKKEQARLRKKYGWDENGKRVASREARGFGRARARAREGDGQDRGLRV